VPIAILFSRLGNRCSGVLGLLEYRVFGTRLPQRDVQSLAKPSLALLSSCDISVWRNTHTPLPHFDRRRHTGSISSSRAGPAPFNAITTYSTRPVRVVHDLTTKSLSRQYSPRLSKRRLSASRIPGASALTVGCPRLRRSNCTRFLIDVYQQTSK
jgi:hypothetical protein